MKKLLSVILTAVLLFVLAACSGGGGGEDDKGFVGVSMPTKSSERWISDGKYMKEEFEKKGY